MTVLGRFLKSGIKVRSVFQQQNAKPEKQQIRTFQKLLSKAVFTQFGEKYNFEEILNLAFYGKEKEFYRQFKKDVPIYDYPKIYAEWWHKSRNGEKNVTWAGKIKYFALSSGTSDSASKAIPVSKEMIKAIHKTSINQILSLAKYKDLPADLYEKGYLMLGGSTLLNEVDSHFEGDLSGITAGKIPFWFDRFYKPGKRIASEKDWAKKLEEIVEQAPNWDIGFLAGVPAWLQLLMERIIEKYNLKNIHEIWPNLAIYGWGGVSFEPYRHGFEKLLGKPLIYIETYLASEGFLAYQSQPDSDLQLVLNNGIFFEFIPFNEKNFDEDGNLTKNPETLMIDEVKENAEYAILISTCAGAWRYIIGDTVKFTNKRTASIKITGRTKHFLNLCGEHLSVENLNKAIELAAEEMKITVREFAVAGIKHPPLFAHQWYVGVDEYVDENAFGKLIDQKLCELNDDYCVERQHSLKNIFMQILPSHLFYDFLKAKGKEGGQNKFPRVLKDKILEEWQLFLEENHALKTSKSNFAATPKNTIPVTIFNL